MYTPNLRVLSPCCSADELGDDSFCSALQLRGLGCKAFSVHVRTLTGCRSNPDLRQRQQVISRCGAAERSKSDSDSIGIEAASLYVTDRYCRVPSCKDPQLLGTSNLGRLVLRWSFLTLPEAVLEAARQVLHVAHAPRAGRLPPDGLHAPVVFPDACSRVAAGGAGALLQVVRAAAAAPAQRVRLVVTLTERAGTLPLLTHGREL